MTAGARIGHAHRRPPHRRRAARPLSAGVPVVGGRRGALVLDGVSALQAGGLTGYIEDVVHVSVPRNAQCPGRSTACASTGSPQAVRPRRGDRPPRPQLAMAIYDSPRPVPAVQQRLTPAHAAVGLGRRSRGACRCVRCCATSPTARSRSVSWTSAALCRRHGVPSPTGWSYAAPLGRIYLDVRGLGRRLVVEIDGDQCGLASPMTTSGRTRSPSTTRRPAHRPRRPSGPRAGLHGQVRRGLADGGRVVKYRAEAPLSETRGAPACRAASGVGRVTTRRGGPRRSGR